MNTIQIPEKTMSSKELYDIVCIARVQLGETQPRVNDFHARVVDELEGEHYEKIVVQNPNKTETTYFNLTIDQCTLVGMRESKAVRRAVLAKLKSVSLPSLPNSFSEALQLAADQAKQLEEQAPKIEVYERLADRKNDVNTTTLAKTLGTSSIKLNKWLKLNGFKWMSKDLPKAGYESWFNIVCDTRNGHEFTQCLISPKGQIEIAKRFDK